MNIVIVLGSGNSGAGAIHDYLVSRMILGFLKIKNLELLMIQTD